MRKIKCTVGEMANMVIPLGVQGDNNATEIRIDYSEWIEDDELIGNPYLEVINPYGTVYGVTPDLEGNVLVWTVSNSDTATCGEGSCRVVLAGTDGEILQSEAARTTVTPAYNAGAAPDALQNWLAQIGSKASSCSEYAQAAKNSAAAAEASAETAANAVENVQNLNEGISYADTFMDVNIPLTMWDEKTENGKTFYEVSFDNSNIPDDEVQATLNLDESAEYIEDCLELETAEGKLYIRTDVLPTGTLNGSVQLAGKLVTQFSNDKVIARIAALEDRVSALEPEE